MNVTYDASPIQKAVKALADRCDGARDEDGTGFNGLDAGFGHSLAKQASWTPKMVIAAYKMIRKYRGQLSNYGIDFDSIVPPPPATDAAWVKPNAPKAPKTFNPSTLRIQGSNFVFTFDIKNPKFGKTLEAVKTLPLRRFDSVNKCWNVPVAVNTAEAVLFVARELEFDIAEGVEETVAELLGKATKAVEASRAAEANFEVQGLGGTLRPFQKAGVAYAVNAKRVLIGDEMGLGKTIQGIATVAHLEAFPCLVVVPASVKLNWKREVEKWVPGKTVEVLNGKAGNYNCHVTIVNYDNLHKHLEAFKNMDLESVIFDEFHYCKNSKAKRSIAAKEIAQGVEIRIGLTGTPVLNRPAELTNLLSILDRLNDVGGWRKLVFDYAEGFNNGYGIEFPKNPSSDKLEELNAKLRATCLVRRTKKQVLTELPEKTRTDVWLTLDNAAEYARAEAQAAKEFRETSKDAIAAFKAGGEPEGNAAHLTRITTLRKLAAQGKLAAVKEWVANFLESGEKLVLFAHHIEIQEALAAEFPGCAVVKGADDVAKRQANVDRFQNDPECKLIVCSLKAAREGITLTAASNVAFVELGWHPGEMQQAEDRVHRITQKNAVNVWYLLAENSIDVDMNDLINQKAVAFKAVAEGNKVTEADILALQESAISNILARIKAKHGKGKK